MNDFLKFIDDLKKTFPVSLNIYYNKNDEWNIVVYKRKCGREYQEIFPDIKVDEYNNVILCRVDCCCDMELAFAKAIVQTKEWLMEYSLDDDE